MSWSEMEFKGTLKKLNHKFCYSRRGSICLANTRTNTPTSNSTLRDWGEKEKEGPANRKIERTSITSRMLLIE